MKIYIIWLIGVILWNFGFPNAIPIADVIAAILLSFLSIGLKKYNLKEKIKFIHGKSYLLPGNIKLIACYHPSPRNVNTKLISERMIVDLFKKARKISMN